MVGLILIVKLHGGRCVVQRSEQVLFHVPDWAAVLCKALQHKFDVVGVQLHKPAAHYLGRAVIPGDPQYLSLGRTGVHQQINDLVDDVLIIRAESEQKVYLQRMRKIFFISQELGKDQIDTAGEYGKRMLRITLAVSLIGCVIILAIRPLILDFYRDKLTETALSYLSIFIIMTTWRLVGEGINTCLICGCFRGGGDSRFGMIVDSIFMWLVAVPATFLAAYVFKLPPVWVYFVMTLDEFEKMPVVFIHYFRKKWLTNITRDFD